MLVEPHVIYGALTSLRTKPPAFWAPPGPEGALLCLSSPRGAGARLKQKSCINLLPKLPFHGGRRIKGKCKIEVKMD